MLELLGSVKSVIHSPWKREGPNWSLNVVKRILLSGPREGDLVMTERGWMQI